MKRLVLLLLLGSAFAIFARAQEFPLKLVVLGSDTSQQDQPIWPRVCPGTGEEPPCSSKDIYPMRTVTVVKVTGRITLRGHTVEYDLTCAKGRFKKCEELRAGSYAARWDGKRLLVRATGKDKSREALYRFDVKRESDLD